MFPLCSDMAAANASARGQRAAILASPLHELTGFYSAVDCLTSGCGSERNFAVAELIRRAAHGWRGGATHAVLQRLWRAGRGCLAGDGANTQGASGRVVCRFWGRRRGSSNRTGQRATAVR